MNNKDYYLQKINNCNIGNIISKGVVDGEIIIKLFSIIEENYHIETIEYIYNNDSYECEWYDVEGFGYGWRWCQFEDEVNDDKLRESLIKDIKFFINNIINNEYEDEIYYIYFLYEEIHHILFFNQSNDNRMYSFRLSNKELNY